MRNLVTFLAFLAVPFIAYAPLSIAQSTDLQVSDAYIRTMPPGRTTTAGFLAVTNNGGQACEITGFESPLSRRVEMHEHLHADGMMRMRPVIGNLTLPAGETLVFKPSGLHIMLFNIDSKIRVGDLTQLQMNTDQCGSTEFTATIRSLAAKPMAGKHH